MLEEAWYWLTLETSTLAQRLGYRKEAAALRARHRRCRRAWKSHLQRTRECLLQSARLTCAQDHGGSALILGGGLLRDVPWRELLALFDAIEVIDVVIHPELRAAAKDSGGRLRAVAMDITGSIESVAKAPDRTPDLTPTRTAELFRRCVHQRWVASVNILSQLPSLPCEWLRAHGVPDDALATFAGSLMEAHVDALAEAPGGICLVTETGEQREDGDGGSELSGEIAEIIPTRLSSRDWEVLDRWQWSLHPPDEHPEGVADSREVVGLHCSAVTR